MSYLSYSIVYGKVLKIDLSFNTFRRDGVTKENNSYSQTLYYICVHCSMKINNITLKLDIVY